MSHIAKLVLAGVFAIIAAGVNWVWLNSAKKPPEYVAARDTLELGSEISSGDLIAVPIPGDFDRLKKSMIPYASQSVLFGMKTSRKYEAGDVFLYRDLEAPNELPKWQELGPFRLISVGERFTGVAKKEQDPASYNQGSNITIAVKRKYDDKTRRLLQIVDPKKREESDKEVSRIIAVQVYPSSGSLTRTETKPDDSDFRLPLGADEVGLFISLDGVENVPSVLLVGDEIGFVVPPETSL